MKKAFSRVVKIRRKNEEGRKVASPQRWVPSEEEEERSATEKCSPGKQRRRGAEKEARPYGNYFPIGKGWGCGKIFRAGKT